MKTLNASSRALTAAAHVVVALTLASGTARAQEAVRPITVVVPFAPGGPTDKVGRAFAEAMQRALSQPVVVENTAGAGGAAGAAKVAKAAPDGHTLLVHNIGMATAPALYRSLPFKVTEDFEYLGLINEVPMTMIARPTMTASNFGDLRKWMEENRGKVNIGNAGIGSASHLCGLLLQQSLGVDMNTMPFKGTGPAMTAMLAGQVDVMCDQTTNTTAPIESGQVKAYAVTSTKRLGTPALSKLPTMDEAGMKGFTVSIWHGVYAPKGTPKATLDRLAAAVRAVLKDGEFIRNQESLGAVTLKESDQRAAPAGHKRFVEAEIAKWTPVIKVAGQYAD